MASAGEGARLIAFYEGSASDDRGRYQSQILRFDDVRLEAVHDFIQWLFRFRSAAARIRRRRCSTMPLDRMLAFYGLQWMGERIAKSPAFPQRSAG